MYLAALDAVRRRTRLLAAFIAFLCVILLVLADIRVDAARAINRTTEALAVELEHADAEEAATTVTSGGTTSPNMTHNITSLIEGAKNNNNTLAIKNIRRIMRQSRAYYTGTSLVTTNSSDSDTGNGTDTDSDTDKDNSTSVVYPPLQRIPVPQGMYGNPYSGPCKPGLIELSVAGTLGKICTRVCAAGSECRDTEETRYMPIDNTLGVCLTLGGSVPYCFSWQPFAVDCPEFAATYYREYNETDVLRFCFYNEPYPWNTRYAMPVHEARSIYGDDWGYRVPFYTDFPHEPYSAIVRRFSRVGSVIVPMCYDGQEECPDGFVCKENITPWGESDPGCLAQWNSSVASINQEECFLRPDALISPQGECTFVDTVTFCNPQFPPLVMALISFIISWVIEFFIFVYPVPEVRAAVLKSIGCLRCCCCKETPEDYDDDRDINAGGNAEDANNNNQEIVVPQEQGSVSSSRATAADGQLPPKPTPAQAELDKNAQQLAPQLQFFANYLAVFKVVRICYNVVTFWAFFAAIADECWGVDNFSVVLWYGFAAIELTRQSAAALMAIYTKSIFGRAPLHSRLPR